jgi:hypothetical protein
MESDVQPWSWVLLIAGWLLIWISSGVSIFSWPGVAILAGGHMLVLSERIWGLPRA